MNNNDFEESCSHYLPHIDMGQIMTEKKKKNPFGNAFITHSYLKGHKRKQEGI
jgi:hypothetical protein